jgi:hypothetical protein
MAAITDGTGPHDATVTALAQTVIAGFCAPSEWSLTFRGLAGGHAG